ncbi:hypothetical protein NW768_001385 [Fusarium equiseti]|uniref:Muc1-extracellular alpha-1,4-glucan glucosidase n=1 Tax=Fusarium equiseti TaxID=61235 RepID=A0ABQ8RQD9_FUSEQ|nr:hypothetical protein NW768_001385 [Fusarium equiseti]
MRAPKVSLVAVLSVFLLLSCLLGNVAGLARRQHPGRYLVVRGNRLVEARRLDGETDNDYGPPLPYYTGEPVVPVDTTSDPSSNEVTATDIETGSSRATMSSEPHAFTGNYTFSRGVSSLPISSVADTDTAMPSAASSAKAGSTTSSEAPTAVGTTAPASSRVIETSGDDILKSADRQLSATWSNRTSSTRTHSSATIERAPVVVTDSTSSNGQAKSSPEVVVSTSFSENSGVTTLTMTTTKVLNTTMTATNMVESTELVPSSTTYPTSFNGTSSLDTSSGLTSEATVPVSLGQTIESMTIPGKDSSRTLTRGTTAASVSEEYPSFSSLSSGSFRTITSESAITQVSVSESVQKTSHVTSRVLNGTTVVTATTYLTTTLDAVTTPDGLSNSSDGSSAATSDGLSGAGTGEVSMTVVSTTAVSSGNFTDAGSSWTTSVPSTAILSTFFTSTSMLSGSLVGSESDVSVGSIQTSSDTLVASSALPANVTSNAATSSVTVTTNSENSVITILPGGIPPIGNATRMASSSASTDYSTSSLSFFNTSATFGSVSSFQETDSFLGWSTSTIVESQTPHTTLGLPPVSFTSFSFSIITTPMTPPNVMTTSTPSLSQNVTVIMSTWTSTITTGLRQTGLTSSVEPTAAHSSSSGYNFSKTLESKTSSVGSWSTSVSNLPDISTSIITRQPTNLPFPINTTIDWQSMTSSMPLTQSAEAVGSSERRTTLTAASSGFIGTAPYVNSTSTIVSTTYSPTSRDAISSKMAFTTYPSWNTTNTVQGPVNSTLGTTTFHAPTESSMSGATPSLNGTAVITSPASTSEHTELVTISGSVSTLTFTNIPVSIITPTSAIFWSSSAVSMSLNNTPPFPFPSNTTVAGTVVPLPPAGTGAHPTIVSTPGDFSTPYRTLTSTIEPKYHTSNTTQHGTVSGSSTSVSTNAPAFPSSNSTTTAAVTFSSMPSWTPDPEPWTTWSTWSLSGKSNPMTTNGLPRITFGNLSSEALVSTTYTRTTTLSLTTTLAEPTTSRSFDGNFSSKASYSTSYTRTTTLFLPTTLAEPSTSQRSFQNLTSDSSSSVSYTSTTTLFLTTTLGGGSTSRVSDAAITSTTSTWMNTTLASAHSSKTTPPWSEVSSTFLTNGSVKGISTSAESSASTPFPMINSTLSQATSSAVGTLTTRYTSNGSAGATTTCETSSATSSTCADSLYYPPHVLSSSVGSFSTDCLAAISGTASSWSYSPVPTASDRISATCSTTGPMSSYSTAHWSNMTNTSGVKDTEINTQVSLTTFKTVTTVQAEMSGSVWDDYPTPTDKVAPSEVLPSDLNFPWGNDSPNHRHQNVSDLGIGVGDGEASKMGDWRLRWENVKDKLKGLWHGQTSESED